MDQCPHHEKIEDKCNQIDKLYKMVNEKVGLKSLIPIMAIVVTVLGIFIAILHGGYTETIKRLEMANTLTMNLTITQTNKVSQDLTDIKVKIATIGESVENIKNGKRRKDK